MKETRRLQFVEEVADILVPIPRPAMRHHAQHRPAVRLDEPVTPGHPVDATFVDVVEILERHDQRVAALNVKRRVPVTEAAEKAFARADLFEVRTPFIGVGVFGEVDGVGV